MYDISRLWRDELVAATLKRELKKRSIEVVSIQQPEYSLSSDSPSSQLVASILESVATFDRSSLVLKMNNGRETKLLKGEFGGGGIPLGFITTKEYFMGLPKTVRFDRKLDHVLRYITSRFRFL